MERLPDNNVFNDHFDKFMLTIKEELYTRFIDFIKQDESRTIIEIPVKKSRGRPKKNETSDGKTVDEPKKKRGRPKKQKPEEQLLITAVEDSDGEINELKTRGRPVLEDRTVDRIVYTNNDVGEINDDNNEPEQIDVVRIELNGEVYLRDGNNKLYSMSNQEYIGVYDELNENIQQV